MLVADAAALLDLAITPDQAAAFARYHELLIAGNAQANLTAIIDDEGVRVRHFLDSLTVLKVVELAAGARVIDVGAGAGFPGLPIAIMRPDVRVTLLEATGKKVVFMREVIAELGLSNCDAVHLRAEDAGHDDGKRAKYDLVVARAVARLPALLEYLLPLAKIGGVCAAMKGSSAHAEADAAARALSVLGGVLTRIDSFDLPNVTEPHHIIIVTKAAHTPTVYPRQAGTPTRKPL